MDIQQFQNISKLAAALAQAKLEFLPIKQSGDASFYSEKAREWISRPYSTFADYVDATKAALSKHSLTVMQPIVEAWDEKEGKWRKVMYTILAHGESDQSIISTYRLQDIYNSKTKLIDPQASGSDQSYAQKNTYRAILGLPPAPSEDTDGEIAQRAYKKAKPASGIPEKAGSKPQQRVEIKPRPKAETKPEYENLANEKKVLDWMELYGLTKADVREISQESFGGKLVRYLQEPQLQQLHITMEAAGLVKAKRVEEIEKKISNGLVYYQLTIEEGEQLRKNHFEGKPYSKFSDADVQRFLLIAEQASPSPGDLAEEIVSPEQPIKT